MEKAEIRDKLGRLQVELAAARTVNDPVPKTCLEITQSSLIQGTR